MPGMQQCQTWATHLIALGVQTFCGSEYTCRIPERRCFLFLIGGLLMGLFGCVQQPLFANIETVEIQEVNVSGLRKSSLEQTGLKRARECLMTTTEVDQEAAVNRALLRNTFLILVADKRGDQTFELYTDQHMKGNAGRYYENKCIYELIQLFTDF